MKHKFSEQMPVLVKNFKDSWKKFKQVLIDRI